MNLPKDIVFQILLNLPVLSLLRFRCVCKDWCALIKSSLFQDTYLALRRARAVDDQVFGLKMKRYDYGIYKSFVTCCWYDDYEPLVLSASAPSSSSNDVEISGNFSGPTAIIDHLNGIVCVQGGNRGDCWEDNMRENWFDITLVNPALREVRKLPVPDLGEDFTCYVFSIGFGYDDATNDYKVFAILTVVELGYNQLGLVYHLSTNTWKKLGLMSELVSHNYPSATDDEFFLSMSGESIFSHGFIHWLMGSYPNYGILTFNLTTELFQDMLLPRGWRYYDDKINPSLFTIGKSTLALVAYTFRTEYEDNSVAQVLDIWVMKEYGDSESWAKLYSISSLPTFQRPLSFWKKDKLLIQTMDSRLICYDLFTGQVLEYEQCDPMCGSYDLSKGQQQNEPGQSDPIRGPLGWGLRFITGHESFVSLKQI